MNIKLVLFVFIVLFGFFFSRGHDPNGVKRKWYVILVISMLVLESALRSIYVGPDTIHYYFGFQSFSDMSWSEIWGSFKRSYLEGEGKDPGYQVFMRLVQLFSEDFNVFLFFCALVFFVPLGIILYRCTTNVMQLIFAFTLYVSLFHIVALSGVRQQLATGFCFMAFLQLDRGHNLKAILLILLGSTVHVSALIFLAVPIFRQFSPKLLKMLHLLSFATIPFVIAYAAPIMLFLASFLANDYYTTYGESQSRGGAFTYIFLMMALSLFCYSVNERRLACDERAKLLYSMLPLLTMTAPLISLNGAMIRVGQYFTLYMMLFVPMVIDSWTKNANRKIVYVGMIAFLILMSMRSGGFDYYFFWQLAV